MKKCLLLFGLLIFVLLLAVLSQKEHSEVLDSDVVVEEEISQNISLANETGDTIR